MKALMASLCSTVLGSLAPCAPSRCPYCPDRSARHWIKWSFYSRYAEGKRERIEVQRYFCKFVGRTFSLLPDGLLPYEYQRTATILRHLRAIFLEGEPVSTRARRSDISRTTLSRHAALFAAAIRNLRLPRQEGALAAAPFLERLLGLAAERIAEIFRTWKELEPKHSILGFYRR